MVWVWEWDVVWVGVCLVVCGRFVVVGILVVVVLGCVGVVGWCGLFGGCMVGVGRLFGGVVMVDVNWGGLWVMGCRCVGCVGCGFVGGVWV